MTTFDVMSLPKVGLADSSQQSFHEIQSIESRMKAQLLTLSSLITDRESAWEEFDSVDARKGGGGSPSSLSSLTFGTDKSPTSSSKNPADFRFKPLSTEGGNVRRRRREDSGTVCSGSSSPSSPHHDCHVNNNNNNSHNADAAHTLSGQFTGNLFGCTSNLGTPILFQPRKWLMESPNLSSLKIDSDEESLESIINEIAASQGPGHADDLLGGDAVVVEHAETSAEAVAISATELRSFPEFHDESENRVVDDGYNTHFNNVNNNHNNNNHHPDNLPHLPYVPSDHSLISIPDPHDPLLSYYFAHFPHMFAPPCCPYPQVSSAPSFDPLQHHQHPMQYAPPLSQLQEPIIINVPNPSGEFPPFGSASSCSVGLSPSFEMLHHPPMIPNHGECFQFGAEGPLPPPPSSAPAPGQPYFPDEQQLQMIPISQHQIPISQHQQHHPFQQGLGNQPLPLQPPECRLQPTLQMQPQMQMQMQPQTFIDQSGNLMVPVSGPHGPTAMMFPPQGDQLIQVLPAGPPNSAVVAAPMIGSSGQVMMPQYQLPRFVHPQPSIASQPIQAPLIVSIPPCPPPPSHSAPAVLAATQPGSLPPPPLSQPPAQVLVAQQPVGPLQQPMVPLQTIQQHPAGPMIPVFNQVPMIAVDVPCSTMPVGVDHYQSPVMPAQRTGVRPLMDIKDDEKNLAKKNVTKAGCVFCRSNGEREREYMAHRLKNPVTNIVECPQLRKFVCPICGATGDSAHTVSYCPANNKWTGSTVKHLKAMRSSAGKKCGRNVAKAGE